MRRVFLLTPSATVTGTVVFVILSLYVIICRLLAEILSQDFLEIKLIRDGDF